MLFHSLPFLVFLFAVLVLDRVLPSWRARKAMLLAASYLFYAAWNPPFVLLLWISTAIDWHAAGKIAASGDPRVRRRWLWVSLVANLGMLGYFKYGGFLLENFTALTAALGIPFQAARPDIVLPVGISFYTFQTLSYTLDVYLGRAKPCGSALDFALYVTFFPQLVAGPIVRATDFLPQTEEPRRATPSELGFGLFLLTLGMFQKVVLADVLLSKAADTVYGWPFGPVHGLDAWIGTLAFAGQIFCDFAGYSTCAIGVALCLGFRLCDNFQFPYAAIGFRDFWRRWHISLSTWLRDYVYIPLGGNRYGALRTGAALMGTMLLGGLWHGAAWTFVAWGALHGLYLVVERAVASRWGGAAWVASRPGRLGLRLLTFVLVCLTWVFFRARGFGAAGLMLGSMLGVIPGGAKVLPVLDIVVVSVVMTALLAGHAFMADRSRHLHETVGGLPSWLLAVLWTAMIVALCLAQGAGDAFLYFQF